MLSPKRTYDSRDSDHLGNASFDHDEKKYERRSALEWFGRWFRCVMTAKWFFLRLLNSLYSEVFVM